MNKGKLTISSPTYGSGKRKIAISVKDSDARIVFLELEIDPDKFAECLTGISEQDCDFEVIGLQNVGKKIETRELIFKMSKYGWKDKKEQAARIAHMETPDGWTPSTHFGSQNSFFTEGKDEYARTTISRWVDK